MLCLLTFEISKDQEGKNFYTQGPWYTCLVYYMICLECGGVLSGRNGKLAHPGYPQNYEPNRDCIYTITVAPRQRIYLVFEYVDLEHSGSQCAYDYVQIKDVYTQDSRRYCDDRSEKSFLSSGRTVEVKFYSDESDVQTGFVLGWREYNFIDPDVKSTAAAPSPLITQPGSVRPSKGIIVSKVYYY